jgi:hypothetical protein
MKKTLILILSVVCCAFSLTLKAQTNEANLLTESDSVEVKLSTRDYLNLLMTPDPKTGAVMNIYQDDLIYLAIEKGLSGEAEEAKGFRIQIFSSNRGASARERAFEIKDILVSKHPNLADEIYITYTSPFWKVRVGNCATNDKAQELRRWIIAEFPEFTTETYIVPSVIYVY